MKKRYFTILIILISLILTFGFSSNISADESSVIHGVVPTKVTAHIIGCSVPPGESVDAYMEFWNVGKLGGEQYSKATLTETVTTAENKTTKYTSEGYFTGGPNGLFHLTLVLEGGTSTRQFGVTDGKEINPGYIIPIDNPEAFDGWSDVATEVIEPTLELRVTDGPIALEGGKLKWTVEAIVTGKPTPTVEFNCEPWESMSGTDDYYTKNITAQKGKIVELTATASNEIYGDKTVTMTFVNEDSGARFSDLAGEVEIRPHNDPEAWSNAKLQNVLMVDMHIRTGNNGSAILSFGDASIFNLKPNSEIVLSSASSKDSNLKLLWGNMMLNIKKMMKDGSMQVEMSQAVCGIKGTILVLSETGTESTVKVIEGTVEFKLLDSSKTVLVNKGESVKASKNGFSEKITFDPTEELKSWESITGQTIETAGDTKADTIKETAESVDKTQVDTIQETTETTIQKTSSQFPAMYIILIILVVLIILTAVAVAVVIIKRKKK